MPNTPTRFPKGSTTAAKNTTLGMYGLEDKTKWHTYFDDFDTYTAAEWAVTNVGTTPTQALTSLDGGNLLLTMAATDDSSSQLQLATGGFSITAGKQAIFKTRFKISDATQSDFVVGLCVLDTTIVGVTGGDGCTDGIFFAKDDATNIPSLYVQKDATNGQKITALPTTIDTNFNTWGWYFNGGSSVEVYKNDAKIATVDLTTTASAFLPDAVLTVTFGVQNGEAVAKTMTMDYIFAAIER
jgi:hypothetical protein